MTPIQIAYFKHFMCDKGLDRLYLSLYRRAKLKGMADGSTEGNPESVEEFFQKTTVNDVIMKAFYFPMNNQFGFEYWKDLNDKWIGYWVSNKDNFINDKYVMLTGTFGILRQNWDNLKHYKVESYDETYARMHMEPPITEEERRVISASGPKEEETEESPDPATILEGFTMVETENSIGGRKMKLNTASINLRNKGYRISFSVKQSEELRKQGYTKVNLLSKEQTKEIALIFNHKVGCSISIKKSEAKDSKTLLVNSKDIALYIHKFYGLTKEVDYFTLKIVSTIQRDNDVIIILKYID